MNSEFPQDPLKISSAQEQNSSKEEKVESSQSRDTLSKEKLYLTIRFTQTCSIPILVDSMAPASAIIQILSRTIPFQKMPILIFKGKVLEPLLSLKVQGVQDKDDIFIYEKVISQMLNLDDQSNPLNNNFINNLKNNQSVCPDFQTTPFEQKIFSILNEVNRLEDLTNNMENIESEAPFNYDFDEYDESETDDYETDDFLGIESDESEFNQYSYDLNLQNSSLSSILNPTNAHSPLMCPPKTMKVKMLTVLGSEPKEVSSQPLPTCYQPQAKITAKNSSIINCPCFKSIEDVSRFFASNSSTYWKW